MVYLETMHAASTTITIRSRSYPVLLVQDDCGRFIAATPDLTEVGKGPSRALALAELARVVRCTHVNPEKRSP